MSRVNMDISVKHNTLYRYDGDVSYAIQKMYLSPRPSKSTKVVNWIIESNLHLIEQVDAFGNIMHIGVVDKQIKELFINVSGSVFVSMPVIKRRVRSAKTSNKDFGLNYVLKKETWLTKSNKEIETIAKLNYKKKESVESLLLIAECIRNRVEYKKGVTGVLTTAVEAWDQGFGVCQDFAHIMLGACRSLGLPSRYVSGYLKEDLNASNATHAWVEIWLGDWVGIDVTNGGLVDDRFLVLAVGLDYLSVAPIRGVRYGGGEEKMTLNIDIS